MKVLGILLFLATSFSAQADVISKTVVRAEKGKIKQEFEHKWTEKRTRTYCEKEVVRWEMVPYWYCYDPYYNDPFYGPGRYGRVGGGFYRGGVYYPHGRFYPRLGQCYEQRYECVSYKTEEYTVDMSREWKVKLVFKGDTKKDWNQKSSIEKYLIEFDTDTKCIKAVSPASPGALKVADLKCKRAIFE